MTVRKHCREMKLPYSSERVFAILHTPSAIRGWWGAARAIVLAQTDGLWAAAWGEDEDKPDYVSAATIKCFDPPRRLTLSDFRYYSKDGPLPFEAELTTEFTVEPRPDGCLLRVIQEGFPADASADAFYAACETGWRNTFDGIRRFLNSGCQ